MEQCSKPNCTHQVTVNVRDESIVGGMPAEVVVSCCETVITRVVGGITQKIGMDGGYYNVVTLTKC